MREKQFNTLAKYFLGVMSVFVIIILITMFLAKQQENNKTDISPEELSLRAETSKYYQKLILQNPETNALTDIQNGMIKMYFDKSLLVDVSGNTPIGILSGEAAKIPSYNRIDLDVKELLKTPSDGLQEDLIYLLDVLAYSRKYNQAIGQHYGLRIAE